MFIELTDHLRCPEDHEEAYLVLLPGRMEGRDVLAGRLGCPVCGRMVDFEDGVVDFGGGARPGGETSLSAAAAPALLGISGPGGYVALVGGATTLVPTLAPLLPGVHLVAVNPPAVLPPEYPASALRAPRLPLKTACLRGIILGSELRGRWAQDAVRATLPGLRVVGEGDPPMLEGLDVLAEAGGVWVGRRSSILKGPAPAPPPAPRRAPRSPP